MWRQGVPVKPDRCQVKFLFKTKILYLQIQCQRPKQFLKIQRDRYTGKASEKEMTRIRRAKLSGKGNVIKYVEYILDQSVFSEVENIDCHRAPNIQIKKPVDMTLTTMQNSRMTQAVSNKQKILFIVTLTGSTHLCHRSLTTRIGLQSIADESRLQRVSLPPSAPTSGCLADIQGRSAAFRVHCTVIQIRNRRSLKLVAVARNPC